MVNYVLAVSRPQPTVIPPKCNNLVAHQIRSGLGAEVPGGAAENGAPIHLRTKGYGLVVIGVR